MGQAVQVEVVADHHNMQLDVLEYLRVCGALLRTEFGSICNHVLALALTNAVERDETTTCRGQLAWCAWGENRGMCRIAMYGYRLRL
jgi:hypothetical protein